MASHRQTLDTRRLPAETSLSIAAAHTVAPVDTVGLVVPDDFVAGFRGGERIDDYRLHWEGEWTSKLFTFVELSRQDIRNFVTDNTSVANGQVDVANVGTNIWLFDGVGLRVAGEVRRSRNLATRHRLPGVANEAASVALGWVHPSRIVSSLKVNYSGAAFTDIDNQDRLGSFWTADAAVEWESSKKHWSISAQLTDIFNEAPQLNGGLSSAGRAGLLTIEYRD